MRCDLLIVHLPPAQALALLEAATEVWERRRLGGHLRDALVALTDALGPTLRETSAEELFDAGKVPTLTGTGGRTTPMDLDAYDRRDAGTLKPYERRPGRVRDR